MPDFRFHPTPNPNSLKITTEIGPFVATGMYSFASAQEAEGHALATALFALKGVENVFLLPQFLTVTKNPGADWDALIPAIEQILAEHFSAAE